MPNHRQLHTSRVIPTGRAVPTWVRTTGWDPGAALRVPARARAWGPVQVSGQGTGWEAPAFPGPVQAGKVRAGTAVARVLAEVSWSTPCLVDLDGRVDLDGLGRYQATPEPG